MPLDFNAPLDNVPLAWNLASCVYTLDADDWRVRCRQQRPELTQNIEDWFTRDHTDEAPRCIRVNDTYWTLILIQGVKRQRTALRLFDAYGDRPEPGPKSGLNAQVKRAATELWDAIANARDGVRNGVLIAGHSFGGATAQALARFIRDDYPSKDVRVITFGAPRVANHRWVQANQIIQHYRYWNDDDPIRLISPRRAEAPAAHAVVPSLVSRHWHDFDHTGSGIMVQNSGNVVRSSSTIGPVTLTEVNLAGWATGIMQNPVTAHSIAEYFRRLGLGVDRGMSLGTDRPGTVFRARSSNNDAPTPPPALVPEVVAQVQAVQAAVVAERTMPLPREYVADQIGVSWAVYHGQDFVTFAGSRARAARIARIANEMQRAAAARGVDATGDIRRVVANML